MKKILGVLLLSLTLLAHNVLAAGKYGNGNGRTSTPRSTPSAPARSAPAAKPISSSSSSVGSRPQNNTYDSAASADKRAEDSQKKWQDYQKQKQAQSAPKPAPSYAGTGGSGTSTYTRPTYTTPNGRVATIDEKDASYWKGRLDQTKLQQRDSRRRFFYSSQYDYYHTRPRVYYDDGIDSDFWWWLRAQPTYVQAQWAYNHQYDIDQRRYNDLVMNAAIAASIAQWNAEHAARNRYWSPSGMDADLMYNDGYLANAVSYNPAPAYHSSGGHGFLTFMKVVFWIALIGVLIWVVIYFLSKRGTSNEDADMKSKSAPKPETKKDIENPLKIEPGSYVNLSTLDEQGLQFEVKEVVGVFRTINGHEHKTTDYLLEAKPLNSEKIRMRIRMNPTPDKSTVSLNERILKLQLSDELEFDGDFYDMLKEDKKDPSAPDFVEFNDDNSVKANWFRIGDVRESFKARLVKVGPEKHIENATVEYWDFNREVGGKTEYLFIEMDENSHLIQLWKGIEIDESEVFA